MASQSGMFLNREDRASLVKELKSKGELVKGKVPQSLLDEAEILESSCDGQGDGQNDFGTGCLACGVDDDHANLLLCEGCNDEYHTYCLEPPLTAVPSGDWFCREFLFIIEKKLQTSLPIEVPFSHLFDRFVPYLLCN